MNLTIDNNDGQGGIDYTPALLREHPLQILRRRGAWATCSGGLDVIGSGLPLPLNRARMMVTDETGAVLFRGVLQADASATKGDAGTTGVVEEPGFHAVEDAWLTSAAPVTSLQPASARSHALTLANAAVSFRGNAALVPAEKSSSVTLSGGREAAAYVTELFRGDGTTGTFALAHPPFREEGSGVLLQDSFDDAALNKSVWTRTDPGSYIALGSGGLHLTGGNGYDGTTLLQFATPVEMGGTLVAEAVGVQLKIGSDGLLLGFYDGLLTHAGCVAGVRVRGTAGARTLVAVVNGVDGTHTYDFSEGHSYTLRVRLHCAELQRVRATYTALVDGVLQQFGGDWVDAPLQIVVEVQDIGLASSTLPTVLYDGAIAASPVHTTFAPVNSTQLMGGMAAVSLQQKGSAWAVSTATDGTRTTRREGDVGTGADFNLSSTGVLTFAPGRVPQPGELLTVLYRRSQRSVAHVVDSDAQQQLTQLALPGLPAWSGHVTTPATRSSADCAAAAKALVALAGGAATGVTGRAEWVRGADISDDVQPGDTLQVQSSEGTLPLTVQSVLLKDGNAAPELLRYTVEFAQNRAESLDFAVDAGLAEDVSSAALAANANASLQNLQGLQVTVATATALQIDSGFDAPDGGGFEVRRSDANFGGAATEDLVLRSPVRSFSIPRLAFAERFFVRMYDDATPRRYSAVSSVVLTSLPVSCGSARGET